MYFDLVYLTLIQPIKCSFLKKRMITILNIYTCTSKFLWTTTLLNNNSKNVIKFQKLLIHFIFTSVTLMMSLSGEIYFNTIYGYIVQHYGGKCIRNLHHTSRFVFSFTIYQQYQPTVGNEF